MFHTGLKCKKKQLYLSPSEPGGPIAPKLHSNAKIEGKLIDTFLPAGFVSQPEHTINALAVLQKAMYPVRALHNIDFRVLVE